MLETCIWNVWRQLQRKQIRRKYPFTLPEIQKPLFWVMMRPSSSWPSWLFYLPCHRVLTRCLFLDSWGLKESRSAWSFAPEPCSWATRKLTVLPGPSSARPSPSCYLTTWRSVERAPCWSSARSAPWKLTGRCACCTCIPTRSRIPKTAPSGPAFASTLCRWEVVERGLCYQIWWSNWLYYRYDSCLKCLSFAF